MGLVAVIFALGLFSVLVLSVTNTVREEHYWYDFLLPYFSSLNSELLTSQSENLPSGLLVSSYDSASYSGLMGKRLETGNLSVELSDYRISALKYYQDDILGGLLGDESGSVVLLESEHAGDQIYEFVAWFLRLRLNEITNQFDYGSDDYQREIQALASSYNINLELITPENPLSLSFLLEALARHGYAKVLVDNDVTLYLKLPSGAVFRINLPDAYSAVSFPVVIFLLLCLILSITLLALPFVQGFERRIRSIETAASRISRGELDARVTSAGEEDAISRLGLSFNSMADHIQRLMYVQKEMIHAVSHELRTPVARIRFGVQMIEDCQNPESIQKQVKGIDGDIQELDELIDEILTYARLEQGGPILAFQQADVAAIVSQVVAEQSSDKPEIKITSEFKKGSEVWKESEIETRYIHRSIQNLVGNAKRYANSRVKVICSFDAETCRIDVEDDGSGIPEDQWESVFTPFSRLDDSRTRSSGGYGLGLSIVRRILYWHGGQAFLGRSSMGGAKFSLVWPRKQTS
jgi:two-component system sensor histidine kinase RstB